MNETRTEKRIKDGINIGALSRLAIEIMGMCAFISIEMDAQRRWQE